MKKLAYLIVGIIIGLGFVASSAYAVITYLPASQGGTGMGTSSVTTTDIGKVLTVLTSDPFRWTLTSVSGLTTLGGFSTSSYTGSISYGSDTGYKAANAICGANFTGSHLCTPDEVLSLIASGSTTSSITAWIANGPPGYTANANDCLGFTSAVATDLGAYWLFTTTTGGQGWLINCSNSKKLACCK